MEPISSLFNIRFADIFNGQNIFLLAAALFWLFIASIQDLKKREVENWWTFSLITFALAYRAFLSVSLWDYWPMAWGLIGLLVGFILANAFYYGRMFAGGDAKLLIAIGVILPMASSWQANMEIIMLFLLLFMIIGAIYGAGYSLALMFMNLGRFKKEYSRIFKNYRKLILIVEIVFIILLAALLMLKIYLGAMLSLLGIIAPILLMYAKAVENSCMMKLVPAKDLTIGDWLAKPLKIGKRKILPDWEGLSEQQLRIIQKKYRGRVLVKQGVPFVPVFFIALAVMLLLVYYKLI